MHISSPLSSPSSSDEPPPYIFGGFSGSGSGGIREQPAFRRIIGSNCKSGSGTRRYHRTTTQHHQQHRRPLRRWDDDSDRALAADTDVLLPSDRRRGSPTAALAEYGTQDSSRRTPRLVRQDAFCAMSTSRDWRSSDYIDDDDELYRLGLLYDDPRDRRESLGRNSFATTASARAHEIHSARFSLDTIAHDEPAYTVRITPASTQRRRRRPGYRYDSHPASTGDDYDMSDASDDDQHTRKIEHLHAPPALALDLSFTAFADNVHQAWPHRRRGCQDGIQDDLYNYHQYHDSHAQALGDERIHHITPSFSQTMQHAVYEIHETNDIHDDYDDGDRRMDTRRTTCPGTPITQTPELVSDDEDIASDDAEWFSLMEDGWTPIEEEVTSLDGASDKQLDTPGGIAISETWVVLGRGQDRLK